MLIRYLDCLLNPRVPGLNTQTFQNWSFRELEVPYLGVFIIRILLYRVTILGSPIFGNPEILKSYRGSYYTLRHIPRLTDFGRFCIHILSFTHSHSLHCRFCLWFPFRSLSINLKGATMETKSKVINDITTSCVLESLSYKPKATAKLRTDLPKQALLGYLLRKRFQYTRTHTHAHTHTPTVNPYTPEQ